MFAIVCFPTIYKLKGSNNNIKFYGGEIGKG